jgi:peptidase C39-like protein
MQDLALATAALAALSAIAFLVGLRMSSRWTKGRLIALCVLALAALLVFVCRYHGTWQIARVLPISGVIVLGNWIPVGGAFFAGVMLGQKTSPPWRRCSLASLILLASGYSVACCFLGHLPVRHRLASQASVAEQSRRSSCGACCAAMLLQHHGIAATEEELVGLCLTSYRGCPALGLYRGLKLKTAGVPWDVEVVTCTLEELLKTRGPLLLRIRIPATTWIDNQGHLRRSQSRFEHAVLMTGAQDSDHIQIVDPAVDSDCRFAWDTDRLRECWTGEALRVVRRSE